MARHGEYETVPLESRGGQPSGSSSQPQKPEHTKCPSGRAVAVFAFLVCLFCAAGFVLGYFIRQGWDGRGCKDPSEIPPELLQCQRDQAASSEINDPKHKLNVHSEILMYSLPTQAGQKLQSNVSSLKDAATGTGSPNDEALCAALMADRKVFESMEYQLKMPDLSTTAMTDLSIAPIQLLDHNDEPVTDIVPQDTKKLMLFFGTDSRADGSLVYLKQGTWADYKVANEAHMQLDDKVVLVGVPPGNTLQEQVEVAEAHGVKGLLVFELPPVDGPCSNTTPAISVWHPNRDRAAIKVVVQPVSCYAAARLMSKYDPVVNSTDAEHLNQQDIGHLSLKARVTSQVIPTVTVTATHLLWTLVGSENPDQIIMVGGRRNSLKGGAGTHNSIMLHQLADILQMTDHEGRWKPRRTIAMVWWGGSEFGPQGMYKWIQEYEEAYRGKVVTYLDIDIMATETGLQFTTDAVLNLLVQSTVSQVASDLQVKTRCESEMVAERGEVKTYTSSQALMREHFGVPVVVLHDYSPAWRTEDGQVLTKCMDYMTGIKTMTQLILSLADAGITQVSLGMSASSIQTGVKHLNTLLPGVKLDREKGETVRQMLDDLMPVTQTLTSAVKQHRQIIMSSRDFNDSGQKRRTNNQIHHTFQLLNKADHMVKRVQFIFNFLQSPISRSGASNLQAEITDLLTDLKKTLQDAILVVRMPV